MLNHDSGQNQGKPSDGPVGPRMRRVPSIVARPIVQQADEKDEVLTPTSPLVSDDESLIGAGPDMIASSGGKVSATDAKAVTTPPRTPPSALRLLGGKVQTGATSPERLVTNNGNNYTP